MQSLTKESQLYLLEEALLVLAASFFLILDTANSDLTSFPVLLVSAILITLICIAWFIYGQKVGLALQVPLWLWLCYLPISLLTSTDPARSWSEMGMLLLAIFFYLLAADLAARGWPGELVVKAVLIAGSIAVVFSWVGVLQWYLQWLQAAPGVWLPTVSYRLSAPNVQAWNFNPIVMLAGARLLYTRNKAGRVALVTLLAAALGLIFLSSSRAGWLGTAAGMLCLAGLYLWKKRVDWKAVWMKFSSRPGLLALVGVLLIAAAVAGGWLLVRQAMQPTHGALLDSRSEYWGPALQTFLASPIFGEGLGTFSNALMAAHSTPPFGIYLHAHSIPFTVLSTTGLVGFALFLILLVLGVKALLAKLRSSNDTHWPVLVGVTAALAAASIHGLFDCFMGKSLGTWVLALAIGTVLGMPAISKDESPHENKSSTTKKRFSAARMWLKRPFWLLLPLLVVWGWVWVDEPVSRGVAAANAGDWRSAVAYFQAALQRAPYQKGVAQQLGLADSHLATVMQSEKIISAASYLSDAARNEDWALDYLNLASTEAQFGAFREAEDDMSRAVLLAPDDALVQLNYGCLEEQMGNPTVAGLAYWRVLTLEPDWLDAYFWRSSPLRTNVHNQWVSQLPDTASPSIEELQAAVAKSPERAETYIDLATAYLAAGKTDEAYHLLLQSDLAYTADGSQRLESRWLQAQILAGRGRLTEAIQLAESALDGYRYQGIGGSGTQQGVIYTQMVWRIPAMGEELAPGVVTIALPDRWGLRMEQLAQWYRQLGNTSRAAGIMAELYTDIPDYQSQ
ncbi:MAG TPA: tetratricopeptide repeat protein, partial [Longilinea sp.]|nr:tetratricopeptide repeat protein [Longilinea sp.]